MIRLPPHVLKTHMTKPEVMAATGWSVTTLWERENQGLLGPREYCGKYRVYRRTAVDEYLRSCIRREG